MAHRKFTDSITDNMEQFKCLELSADEKELAKRIGDEFFAAIGQIERKYGYKRQLAKMALSFAVFSCADGIVQSGSGIEEDGASNIIVPH
jgi:hypothetical protein